MLLSGRVSEGTKEAVTSRADLPILCVVSKEDKVSLSDMVDIYKTTRNPASDLMVHSDIGLGNAMFIMWAAKHPDEKPLQETVTEWLVERLQPSVGAQEVSFQSEDGYTLYGSFRAPKSGTKPKAPGVVFVHSNLSDRYVFDDLEREIAELGFVTLNFDFRGRGKSRGKGSHFDLPQAERDKGYLDVKAALNFLASHQSVDPNRLIVVATSVGTRYGIKAANPDPRVKSFVMLGGLPEKADVEKVHYPVLFVSSLGIPQIATAFREFYTMTKDRGSRLLEYNVGGVGYHIFDLDEGLRPSIVQWLKAQFALP
jgi:dienelactone hydrolase